LGIHVSKHHTTESRTSKSSLPRVLKINCSHEGLE
jgi:hypothetical protein